MPDIDLATRFPHLSQGVRWRNTAMTGCRLITGAPDTNRLQSVNMVPFVDNRVIVISLANGHFMLPGGTRERDESLLQTISREMLEETGCVLDSCFPFAVLECISYDAKPWRDYLVHPEFERLICIGDVRRISLPENPAGAEQVTRIQILPLHEATTILRRAGRPELGDIYTLAAEIRESPKNLIDLTIDGSIADS